MRGILQAVVTTGDWNPETHGVQGWVSQCSSNGSSGCYWSAGSLISSTAHCVSWEKTAKRSQTLPSDSVYFFINVWFGSKTFKVIFLKTPWKKYSPSIINSQWCEVTVSRQNRNIRRAMGRTQGCAGAQHTGPASSAHTTLQVCPSVGSDIRVLGLSPPHHVTQRRPLTKLGFWFFSPCNKGY